MIRKGQGDAPSIVLGALFVFMLAIAIVALKSVFNITLLEEIVIEHEEVGQSTDLYSILEYNLCNNGHPTACKRPLKELIVIAESTGDYSNVEVYCEPDGLEVVNARGCIDRAIEYIRETTERTVVVAIGNKAFPTGSPTPTGEPFHLIRLPAPDKTPIEVKIYQ